MIKHVKLSVPPPPLPRHHRPVTLFSGLTLPAGTYYVTIVPKTWGSVAVVYGTTPVTDDGASLIDANLFAQDARINTYPPASTFDSNTLNTIVISVSGDVGSHPKFVFVPPTPPNGAVVKAGAAVQIAWTGGHALPQTVLLSLVNKTKNKVVLTFAKSLTISSTPGSHTYTVPANFFADQKNVPTDLFCFYVQDMDKTVWLYSGSFSIRE